MSLNLTEITDYLFCSLYFYLKYRDPIPGLQASSMSTTDLPGRAISQALQVYAGGKFPDMNFRLIVRAVWATWMNQKNVEKDAITMILAYEDLRNKIMWDFLSGKISKKGGARYIEPRLTSRYKQMMDHAGLWTIAKRVEENLLPLFGVTPVELEKIGRYRIADAYADSMLMADQYQLPSRKAILGIDMAVPILTGNGIKTTTKINALIKGQGGTIAVIHDSFPEFYLDRTWIGRDLRVIAASLYKGNNENIEPVSEVVFKHLISGASITRKQLRASRLSLSLLHAIRGIEADIYLPQFLSGDLSRCKRCPAAYVCLNNAEDPIESLFPGTISWAERVVEAALEIEEANKPEITHLAQILGKRKITPQDLQKFAGR